MSEGQSGPLPAGMERSREEIEAWLVAFLADLLGVPPAEVAPQAGFARLGLDSSAAVGITDALGRWLGRELSPTALYDHPTIASLAEHLAGGSQSRAA